VVAIDVAATIAVATRIIAVETTTIVPLLCDMFEAILVGLAVGRWQHKA
jgi:hypothetical protein